MKFKHLVILITILLFHQVAKAQINYSDFPFFDAVKIEYIGKNDTNTYYSSPTYYSSRANKLNYLKVNILDGKAQLIEKPIITHGKNKYNLLKSILLENEIFELYKSRIKGNLLLVKRNVKTFGIISQSEPIPTNQLIHLTYAPLTTSLNMYACKNGVFIHGNTVGTAFIKVIDKDLNVIYSEDLSEYYSYESSGAPISYVNGVHFDKTNGYIILNLNLNKSKATNGWHSLLTYQMGLMILDGKGNHKLIKPKMKDQLTYSHSNFYYDEKINTVTGIFNTHGKVENSDVLVGSGYAVITWDAEDGKIINMVQKEFIYADLISPKTLQFLKFIHPKMKIKEGNKPLTKLKYTPTISKLKNGDYLITYNNLFTKLKGYFPPSVYHSIFLICLDSNGKEKWTLFHENIDHEKVSSTGANPSLNRYMLLSTGRSINYPDNKYSLISGKGKVDILALTTIDLETGNIISRKSLGAFKGLKFDNEMIVNEEKQSIFMIFQKNSTSFDSRTYKIGVLKY